MNKQFLSCDWGTSSFRLRLINLADGAILAETTNGKGIAAVYNEWLASGKKAEERVSFYQQILLSAIQQLNVSNDVPLIISGMASSSIGIKELPYGEIPFPIDKKSLPAERIPASDKFNHDMIIVSGLKTGDDVMRGEETMLLGCDINDQEWLVIFPGTHSKHVAVKNKTVLDFKTYMTGELFDLLTNQSILSKSVEKNNEVDQHQFEKGVKEGVSGNLLNLTFHVRTNQLFGKMQPKQNYHYLSGLLIGYELKELSRNEQNIMLVCSSHLAKPYSRALELLRNKSIFHRNADEALVAGHIKIVTA